MRGYAVASTGGTYALRLAAISWSVLTMLVAAAGLAVGLLTPGDWLVSVGVSSALFGGLLAMALAGWRGTPVTPALAARSIAGCALVLVSLVGLSRLLGPGIGPVLGALALTGIPLAVPLVRLPLLEHGAAHPNPCAPGTVRRALELDVRSADLDTLCLSWGITEQCVLSATDPYELAVLADVRRRYLDELERRDPQGFAQQLAAIETSPEFAFRTPSTPRRDSRGLDT